MSENLNMNQPKLKEFSDFLAGKSKEFAELLRKKFVKGFTPEFQAYADNLFKNVSPWEEGRIWERLFNILIARAEGKTDAAKQMLPSGGHKKGASGSEFTDRKDDHEASHSSPAKKPPSSPKGST